VITDPEQLGILVAGKAGVGKTRLLREVVNAAAGCQIKFVTATESARPIPFGAFAHLLPEHLDSIDRIDLLAVVGRHIVSRSGAKPTVLAIDDIHLLDGPSAALVHFIATNRLGTVLMTLRSGETAPDAVAALHRDDVLERLDLQPISRVEFDQLLQAALGGPIESLTLDRMWAVTEGNVLFARELVGDLTNEGSLAPAHGIWRWSGRVGAAPRLKETVAARLGDLEVGEQQLLEYLAVGEPLSLASAQRLVPDVSVPDLERRGLVVVDATSGQFGVRLAHPMFGESIRSSLPMSLSSRINHDLAEDLASTSDHRDADPLRLALLRQAAGDNVELDLLVEAARIAVTLADYPLAERLARTAVDQGGGFDAALELGRSLLGQDRFAETEGFLRPLLGNEPTDPGRAVVADSLAQAIGHGLGRLEESIEILESTERNVTDPKAKARLLGSIGIVLAHSAHFVEAAEVGMAALSLVDDEETRLHSIGSVNTSLCMAGRITESLQLSEEALEPATRLQHRFPRALGWVVGTRSLALWFAGRSEESLNLLRGVLALIPNPPAEFVANTNAYLGRFTLSLGRPQTAAVLLDDAALTLRDSPSSVEPSWCLALSAEAHALLGQHDVAMRLAGEAVALRRDEMLVTHADELRALAWVDAQSGRSSLAIDQLWVAADFAASRGQRSFELIILCDLLRLGEHRVANRTHELAQHVDGSWSAAIDEYSLAVLNGSSSELEAAAAAFGVIGSSLVAAELWAIASAEREREGLTARASEASRKSASELRLCEGARSPLLGRAVARDPLTRRERETALLASRGATNAEIASELKVTVRTVESHLHAVFGKLGVTSRNELPGVFDYL
jgi:DNA-binding CsgD family transcriptional regulator